jgi:hypothetical protein
MGEVMDRRSALKASLTFTALALCPGAALTRPAQGAAPFVVAVELAVALASLAIDMKKAASASDDEMLGRLNGIGAKLDTLQKSIGPSLEAELEKHEIRTLVHAIAGKEASIIETLYEMNHGERFGEDLVLRFAFDQRDLRNQLIQGDYGPNVYPFVSRSFLSEAMIYFAVRNKSVAFHTSKAVCCNYLVNCCRAFDSAAQENERAEKITPPGVKSVDMIFKAFKYKNQLATCARLGNAIVQIDYPRPKQS